MVKVTPRVCSGGDDCGQSARHETGLSGACRCQYEQIAIEMAENLLLLGVGIAHTIGRRVGFLMDGGKVKGENGWVGVVGRTRLKGDRWSCMGEFVAVRCDFSRPTCCLIGNFPNKTRDSG